MSVQNYQTYLRTESLGRQFEYHEELDSTNTRASSLIAKGAQDGLVVVTDHQIRGRGTRGRTWLSTPGQNLTFTCILSLESDPNLLPLLGLETAVAIRKAIVSIDSFLNPLLKWPNDLLIHGKKCAGILLESTMSTNPKQGQSIVLGIGINVNQTEFDQEVKDKASSLRLENGQMWPLDALLAGILNNLEPKINQFFRRNQAPDLSEYRQHLQGLNEPISLVLAGADSNPILGVLRGVSDEGGILIESNKKTESYFSGSISTLGELSF